MFRLETGSGAEGRKGGEMIHRDMKKGSWEERSRKVKFGDH